MKYALVNDELQEAQPGLSGRCPCCDSVVIAKCGDIKIEHWSHHKVRRCDPWWENETEWHRSWKSHFPKEWQEIVLRADDGEKHIADVKTNLGYVIEFQHSHIKPEERQSREDFYKRMIWIVDGKRRLRDKDKFLEGWDWADRIDGRDDLRKSPGGGPLLRDWSGRSVTVFFDFGEQSLWGILPKTAEGNEYGFMVDKRKVIDSLNPSVDGNSSFEVLLRDYLGKIEAHEWREKFKRERGQIDPLMGLQFRQTRYPSRWRR